MRTTILFLISFLILSNIARAEIDLLAGRGFVDQKCYQHQAVLICQYQQICLLQLFGGAHRLSISTNVSDLKNILPERLAGKFTFEFKKNKPSDQAFLKFFEKLSFDNEPNPVDELGLANPVECLKP